MAGRKVSTLCLDRKGGFDNVNPSTLCGMLRAKGVNPYLVSWTKSFLCGGMCQLLYQGSPKCSPQFQWAPPRGPQSPRFCLLFTFPASTTRSPMVSTTPHIVKRLAKAQAAFMAVQRLCPLGIALPASGFLCHRLPSSLLFPIRSYGADAFPPTVHMRKKLSAFWHNVQR